MKVGMRVASWLVVVAVGIMTWSIAAGAEEVDIWAWWDASPQQVADLEEYVGAKVNFRNVPYGEFLQQLVVAIVGGVSPDVVYVDMNWFDDFLEQGALYDVTPYFERNPYQLPLDDLFPAALQLWERGGRQYGVTTRIDLSLTWYNRTMLDELGLRDLDDSFDWNQWLDYAGKATRDINGDGQFDRKGNMDWWWEIATAIWSNGGEIFRDGQLALDSPEVEETLNFYKQFYDFEIIVAPGDLAHVGYDNPEDAWRNGMVLFAPGGAWVGPGTIRDPQTGEWTFDPGVGHVPAAPGKGRVGLSAGNGIAIAAGTKNPDLAWKALSYFLDDEYQTMLARDGLLPARLSIALSEDFLPEQDFPFNKQTIIDAVAYQRPPDLGVRWSQTFANAGSPVKSTFRGFFRGEIGYSAAMDTIKTQVNAILSDR